MLPTVKWAHTRQGSKASWPPPLFLSLHGCGLTFVSTIYKNPRVLGHTLLYQMISFQRALKAFCADYNGKEAFEDPWIAASLKQFAITWVCLERKTERGSWPALRSLPGIWPDCSKPFQPLHFSQSWLRLLWRSRHQETRDGQLFSSKLTENTHRNSCHLSQTGILNDLSTWKNFVGTVKSNPKTKLWEFPNW